MTPGLTDGAIAFLIEDISSEVTLSRSFRAEVDQYEAVLNTVEDASVVFSAGGVITFSNKAYHQVWGQNPEVAFADVTASDAIKVWRKTAQADWGLVDEFINMLGPRTQTDIPLLRGPAGIHSVRLFPIGSDATLVRFSTAKMQTSDLAVPAE